MMILPKKIDETNYGNLYFHFFLLKGDDPEVAILGCATKTTQFQVNTPHLSIFKDNIQIRYVVFCGFFCYSSSLLTWQQSMKSFPALLCTLHLWSNWLESFFGLFRLRWRQADLQSGDK